MATPDGMGVIYDPTNSTGKMRPMLLDDLGQVLVSSAARLPSGQQQRPVLVAGTFNWNIQNSPAVNTRATATRAAAGAGVRNVATYIYATCSIFAALAAPLQVVVRDGASGAGTVIFATTFIAPAGSTYAVNLPLALAGSANTAMTVEFSTAPGATNFEDVWLSGYTIVLT